MPDTGRGERDVPATPRRHLTILFSDLSGFSKFASAVEPEFTLDVLNHLRECSTRVVRKYGGIIVEVRGDGVVAMFGFPQATEQDGRRATEAALEMHEAIRGLPLGGVSSDLPPLHLHSGIHCGQVVLEQNLHSPNRYEFGGNVTTVAARLSDRAGPDEILVSATTLGGESHFFEIRDLGHLVLDGIVEPFAVIQVLGHSSVSTRYEARTQTGMTPFVGRTQELELLKQSLDDVLAGAACEVAVVASAGVGKTRLVEQFLHQAARLPTQVCRGYCENYLGAEPLQPFLQILRQLSKPESVESLAGSDPDGARRQESRDVSQSPELQRALAIGLLSNKLAAPRSADNAVGALCELFAATAGRHPLVVFIDDWQWADDATRQVVATLREMKLHSMLLLIASRDPPDADRTGGIRTLELAPFDRGEAALAIRALRPDVDPIATDHIQQLSGGNPLFIEELCHRARLAGAGLDTDRRGSLPAWLSTLIESRVGRLPTAQVELVRVAAVLGTVVPAWLLEHVTGYGSEDPIFDQLSQKDLIYRGEFEGTWRFKHGITRDVIYASVGLREREALHRRIGNLLEQRAIEQGYESLLEALSYHFRAAAEPQRAAHYAGLAGDKALAAAAPDRARNQYAAALTALDSMAWSDEIYQRWSLIVHRFGLACVFDPTRDQLRIFDRAVARSRERSDYSGMARAEYWLGLVHYALGDSGTAIRHYDVARACCAQAHATATSGGDSECAMEMEALGVQLLATMGQARAAACEHEVALDLLDEALAVKRRHRRAGHPAVGSAYALACKGAVLGYLGRFAEAYDCFDEALEAIRAGHSAVESSVVGWRSAVCLWHGRWRDARECAIRAQNLAQRVGSLYVIAMGQSVAAYATWMLDQAPGSIDAIAQATSWLESRDKRLSISMSYGWLADVAAAMGDSPRTRLYAARAIRRARMRDPLGEAAGYRAMANLPSLPSGRSPDAYLDLAMRSSIARRSPREEVVTLLHQGQHAARSGHRQDAYHMLQRARSAFSSMEMAWHETLARQTLATLDQTHSAS
jgi:class 3 adenylate cyclase/tetratricopeptide (TPR) repeat protein